MTAAARPGRALQPQLKLVIFRLQLPAAARHQRPRGGGGTAQLAAAASCRHGRHAELCKHTARHRGLLLRGDCCCERRGKFQKWR